MKEIFLWVEQFLNKFSYGGKIRFICALGIFYAIFLISEIFLTQHSLIQMFHHKIRGLERHKELIRVLEYSSDLQMLLANRKMNPMEIEEKPETLLDAINESLKSIKNEMQVDVSHVNLLESVSIRDKNLLIDKIVKQWESVKITKKKIREIPIVVLMDFSKNILELIDKNMEDNSLKLGVEMPILLISDVAMARIPKVQNVVKNIAMLPLQIKQGMTENEAKLTYQQLLMALQEKIKTIEIQLSHVIKENHMAGDDLKAAQVKAIFDQWEKIMKNYIQYLLEPHNHFKISLVFTKQILKEGWKIEASFIEFLDREIHEVIKTLYRRQRVSFLVLLIGLIAFLAMYVTRIIRRPLEELKLAAIALADGNLSVRVPVTSKDEVAVIIRAFNEMAEAWECSLIKAKDLTLRLVDTSISIFDIVKRLESNVARQEASVDLVKAQSREIGLTTQKFNQVLREVNKSLITSSGIAEVGRANVFEMEAVTQQMKEASRLLVDTLALIRGQVDKINGVLITVVSIADQSNLLSLNTAIRASQTGMKGVGFAVVAGKIRELADRTAFATLDIEQIVQDIVTTVSSAVLDVENFSSQILDQVADEKKISELLNVRIDQTQEQLKSFEKIQNDMDVQFKESLQITSLINDLLHVTSETAKSARNLKQDAEFLYQGAQNLQEIISRFHFQERSYRQLGLKTQIAP